MLPVIVYLCVNKIKFCTREFDIELENMIIISVVRAGNLPFRQVNIPVYCVLQLLFFSICLNMKHLEKCGTDLFEI